MLDPFAGSNMTGRVAETLDRNWLAFELNEVYINTSKFRFEQDAPSVVEPLPLEKTNSDLLKLDRDYIDELYTLTPQQKYFLLF